MAPNLLIPANTVPDFGISTYLLDHRLGADTALELKDPAQRPLAPEGGTPTGHVMMSFADLMKATASRSVWMTRMETTGAPRLEAYSVDESSRAGTCLCTCRSVRRYAMSASRSASVIAAKCGM